MASSSSSAASALPPKDEQQQHPPPSSSSNNNNSNKSTPGSTTRKNNTNNSNNNYALPNTPIASAKRPRSSLEKSSSRRLSMTSMNNNSNTPAATGNTTTTSIMSMSPMHPPRPPTSSNHHHAQCGQYHQHGTGVTVAGTNAALPPPTMTTTPATVQEHNDNNKLQTLEQQQQNQEESSSPSMSLSSPNDSSVSSSPSASSSNTSSSSWVTRHVDALFSPVLNFLGTGTTSSTEDAMQDKTTTTTTTTTEEDDDDDDEEEVHAVTDEDVAMTTTTTTTITSPSATAFANNKNNDNGNDIVMDVADAEDGLSPMQQLLHYNDNHNEELHHDMQDLEETPSNSFDDGEEEFNPYLFIKSLPPYHLVKGPPRTCLPPPPTLSSSLSQATTTSSSTTTSTSSSMEDRLTLVLDLDETLVHCTVDAIADSDLEFPVTFHGMEYHVHVKLRPYLQEFLRAVATKYEVVVFTASQKVYANELLNRIDPDNKYIHHRLFRESCLAVEGNFLKDLNVLGRNLKRTVLVDNSPHAFGYQVDNGIPIESWFDDPHDVELLKLQQFLTRLEDAADVRPVVRAQFQTQKKIDRAKLC